MVQRLAYLAFTEEAGVRLPVTEYLFVSPAFRSPKAPVRETITDLQNKTYFVYQLRISGVCGSYAERQSSLQSLVVFDNRTLPSMSR